MRFRRDDLTITSNIFQPALSSCKVIFLKLICTSKASFVFKNNLMTPVQSCLLDSCWNFSPYIKYAFSKCQNANFQCVVINGRLSKLKNISRLHSRKRKLFRVNGGLRVTYFPCLRMRQGAIKEIENSYTSQEMRSKVYYYCTTPWSGRQIFLQAKIKHCYIQNGTQIVDNNFSIFPV